MAVFSVIAIFRRFANSDYQRNALAKRSRIFVFCHMATLQLVFGCRVPPHYAPK
jgi:hypothetical protein